MRSLIQSFVAGIAGAATVVALMGATSIKSDGSIETDQQLISNAERGTPPLVVRSSSLVPNLNADSVDGLGASSFALAANSYTKAEVDSLLADSRDHRRAFYLTTTGWDGANADGTDGNGAGVCANGFHFASFWEVSDVSTLRYATDVEGEADVHRTADSGLGPPTASYGFVRTGRTSSGSGTAGTANCEAWSSNDPAHRGTLVSLPWDWNNSALGVSPWAAIADICNDTWQVWCVEDYPGATG